MTSQGKTTPTHYVVVVSDCHLSAGRFFDGKLNPHEDFHFDDEFIDLLSYFSAGAFGTGPNGPVPVEFFINGDFLDFLAVPVQGEFEDAITEPMALEKLDAIIAGHARVMKALKTFASQPGKSITYLIGNHDADLFFNRVREKIVRTWDPEGQFPSNKVKLIADTDRVHFEGGIEIHHGNQLEAQNELNFGQPLLSEGLDEPILRLPWGSFFVLKIINRLKWQRPFIDKVRPIKLFVLFGLLVDFRFTLRFMFLSFYYFLKTRLVWSPKRSANIKKTVEILRQEAVLFLDLEREARQMLDAKPELKTIVFGHTHRPMDRIYPDGKQYINTGTWTRMVNLDWARIGEKYSLTFALLQIQDGQARCELRHWVGEHSPHQSYSG